MCSVFKMNPKKHEETCLNNGKSGIIPKRNQISLLKKNYNNALIIRNNNLIQKEISTRKPATGFVVNPSQIQTLASVNFLPNQTIDKDYNCMTYSHAVQSKAVETIVSPVQVMPIAFQTAEQQNTITLQMQYASSIDQKAVGNYTKTTTLISSAAPSGTKSATVNHTNRSLVYREEPVSTNTAPITIFNEINLIDLTNSNPSEKFTSNSSSAIDQCVENCFLTNDTVCVTSGELFPVPSVNSYARNIEQSVSGTNYQTSQAYTQHLQQNHHISTKITANDHYTHVQQNFQQFSEFEKVNVSEQKRLQSTNTKSMSEILSAGQKRSRAKSTFISDGAMAVSGAAKISRTKSNETLEIINLDNLPEKKDYLYNMLKSDCEKVLMEKRVLEIKPDVKTFSIASGSKSIQISNGQLSDINGPIRLLDKSAKHITTPGIMHIARIQSQNAAIASLSTKDKKRKLQEEIETKEMVLNLLENGEEKQIKRTYGRSNSFNLKPKLHFKIGNISNNPPKKCPRKPIKTINHDQDWQAFADAMSSISKGDDLSSGKCTPNEQINNENDTQKTQIPTEIEQILSWNTQKTLGQLPNTQLIFQRNEFDMTEMDVLAMTKIKAMKQRRNDYKNFSQLEPSMACGHTYSTTCFDSIIQRLNGGNSKNHCKVNEKQPHQYYSNEFKQIIGALVQNNNNNCQAITVDDIKNALRETNMYDRTKNSSHFSWTRFIDYYNRKYSKRIHLAPPDLFVNTIPKTPNTFEIGQKLEAIDPNCCSLFCVCTIVDKCGYRIKLRFDGYSATYDFWVNADSMNIFPAGWCQRTGRELDSSRRLMNNRTMQFDWTEYLRQTNTQAAHSLCFPNINTAKTQMNPFKIGMKLEADDIKKSERICVATIGDVIDSRVLVTLDDMESRFNYWADIRSPYIHPTNFHREGNYSIVSPPSWRVTPFSWDSYLRHNRAEQVPRDAFHPREPKAFTEGMALEVVDKKNPSLIRPAVIIMTEDYHIKVLFIGWPEKYAYWLDDDSCNIFPPGYCKKTGHPIECPLDDFIYELPKSSCGVLGCRGIGNGKRPDATSHKTLEECPYEENNWANTMENEIRANRVDRKHKTFNTAFNIGAGPSRKVSVNPAFEKVQVSLQPTLNPAELAAMSSKDVEIFRRLQVSASFLLENRKALSELRDQWMDRLKPLRPIQVLASLKNPLNWSKEEVAKFVSQLPNCSTLGPIFMENDIDGLAFLSLRQSDMIDIMGLSTGAAIKVFNRIMLLREECNAHYIRYT